MTLQTLVKRYAAALVVAATAFTTAHAQPSAASTVSPPVRADIALSDTVLTSRNAGDHLAWRARCRRC